MTSRSEYRLILRQDNADLRLTEMGYKIGLVSEERYSKFLKRKEAIENEIERIKNVQITNKKEVNQFLEGMDSVPLRKPISLYELIKRPELNYFIVKELDENRPDLPEDVQEQINITSKYEGYIQKQLEQVNQFKKMENRLIPEKFDYKSVKGLRIEAIQKLDKMKPVNLGQASRISGVSPADISVLLVALEQYNRQVNKEDKSIE
jgi:tRNA uridine 5-carboxymethylaminomethyl modification enzyme